MTRRCLLALGVLLLGVPTIAQQPTFKTSVDLVSVDVLATAHGQPLTGLTASDFEILDSDVLQQIDSTSGEGTIALQRVPIDVVLVFDISESMAGARLQQLKDAGKGVLQLLRPEDRVALVTFCQRPAIEHPLSSDTASVTKALDGLVAKGGTAMFDALYTGLMLRRTTTSRAMLLLFSDGRDNSSWLGAKEIAQVARESDVVVYAVGLDAEVSDEMKAIARETGGAETLAGAANDLKALFTKMVREMQGRYVLSYYPKGVPREGWHPIEVRLTKRQAEISARRGYYVAAR